MRRAAYTTLRKHLGGAEVLNVKRSSSGKRTRFHASAHREAGQDRPFLMDPSTGAEIDRDNCVKILTYYHYQIDIL